MGQTTTEKQPEQNTFLIWRGAGPADFELKCEYKLTGYNSGIQYRSIELPDIKWAMKGYQADIDGEQQYTGQIYEERGRGFLALRGAVPRTSPKVRSRGWSVRWAILTKLKGLIHGDGWNSLDIVARGNTLAQTLNGRVMSMFSGR